MDAALGHALKLLYQYEYMLSCDHVIFVHSIVLYLFILRTFCRTIYPISFVLRQKRVTRTRPRVPVVPGEILRNSPRGRPTYNAIRKTASRRFLEPDAPAPREGPRQRKPATID